MLFSKLSQETADWRSDIADIAENFEDNSAIYREI